jgi:hypothetical protein
MPNHKSNPFLVRYKLEDTHLDLYGPNLEFRNTLAPPFLHVSLLRPAALINDQIRVYGE